MRILLISLFLLYNGLFAQDIPLERLTDWTNVGTKIAVPSEDNLINFQLLKQEMLLTDDETISYILNNLESEFNKIYFQDGIYNFTKPINLKDSVSIIGESSELTILNFDLGGNYNLISSLGSSKNDTLYIDYNLNSHSNSIIIENNKLNAGDVIYLFDEDTNKITSDWAKHSTGQIIEIESVTNDLVLLKSKLRRDFKLEDQPRFVTLKLRKNISISNITLNRLDQTESQTSNIYLEYAKDASVSCIRSYNSNFAHITIANSLNCQVTGSYFQDGFDYGGGGKAYGVMLQFATSECLIYNNQFNHLRHSMILQAGANGNVISYNYSKDPFWTEVSLPANSSGDLVLHGNYVYSNLFEGNIIQQIVIDDSHGQNGKFNTFLRNRAELYGIFMNAGTNSQNFIGNEVINTTFLMGNYVLSGSDHFEYGNNIKGKTNPSNTDEVKINSLYLTDKLDYYNLMNWPPIGLPNKIGTNIIEAENSDKNGLLTACDFIESSIDLVEITSNLNIYPNPIINTEKLNITTNNIFNDVAIFDLQGNVLFEFIFNLSSFELDLINYKAGVYVLRINNVYEKIIIR